MTNSPVAAYGTQSKLISVRAPNHGVVWIWAIPLLAVLVSFGLGLLGRRLQQERTINAEAALE